MQPKILSESHCEKICENGAPLNETIIPLTHVQKQPFQKYAKHIQILNN